MATVVDRQSYGGSGLLIAVAVMAALVAVVVVNFVYNNQGLSVAPTVQTPPVTTSSAPSPSQ